MKITRPNVTVEYLNRLSIGHFPAYIGMRVLDVSDGALRARLELREQHFAPNGFLHAGSIVAFADTAAGYACLAHLPDAAAGFTTLELKTNFMATVREGAILAETKSVHLGKTTQVWDCEILAEETKRVLAAFRCTQMIIHPKS